MYEETQRLIPVQYSLTKASSLSILIAGGMFIIGSTTVLQSLIGAVVIFILLSILYGISYIARLHIVLTGDEIKVRLGPFGNETVPVEEINDIIVCDNDPGSGIGVKRLSDGTRQFRLRGTPVRIKRRNNNDLLVTMKDADSFADKMNSLMSS